MEKLVECALEDVSGDANRGAQARVRYPDRMQRVALLT
jgi:hypothetical protein